MAMDIDDFGKLLDAKLETVHNKLDSMEKRLDNGEKRFAGKWVEKITVGVLIALIASITIFIVTK